MLLYAITQRSLFSGDESARSAALLAQARALAGSGVHYFQIREKGLPQSALQALAASIVTAAQSENSQMKILLNGPAAMALECGCDGVHLSSAAPPGAAIAAKQLYRRAGCECVISAACHTLHEVQERSHYADLLLFSPVFEKITPQGVIHGAGLAALSGAVVSAHGAPVLALGGVTAQNAGSCAAAGAKGIASIRLFLHEEWKPLIHA